MKNTTLILSAILALIAGPALANEDTTNGCNQTGAYTYSASMSAAAVAVHRAVQAASTCAKPTDPTDYIRLSLIRAKQNPGGGDSGDSGSK